MLQTVGPFSSSVRMANVSQTRLCVTETTTAETTPMNRTVVPPLRHQVRVVFTRTALCYPSICCHHSVAR